MYFRICSHIQQKNYARKGLSIGILIFRWIYAGGWQKKIENAQNLRRYILAGKFLLTRLIQELYHRVCWIIQIQLLFPIIP